MTTPVDTGQPGFGYGLGLAVIQTPSGRLIGHDGAIPGFLNIVLNTEDGRRQLGLMINELIPPTAVVQAFTQTWMAIAAQLLEAAPKSATPSASLPATIQVATLTDTHGTGASPGMGRKAGSIRQLLQVVAESKGPSAVQPARIAQVTGSPDPAGPWLLTAGH
jgi:hypothetical protein